MRLTWLLILLCLCSATAAAQEAPDVAARRLFEEGYALSQSEKWAEAAERFEQSLALADRPGTRVNLVHVYEQLGRPLEVVEHALAFLGLPAEPHRAEARASAEASLSQAAAQLAVLELQSVPTASVLLVDGEPPLRDATRVFVEPGLHRLELRLVGAPAEVIELHLARGHDLPWPRQGRITAPLDELVTTPVSQRDEPLAIAPAASIDGSSFHEPEVPRSRWRSRLSIVNGTLGASLQLASLGVFILTLRRAHDLRRADPYEIGGGFVSQSDDYLRASNAIAPLAIAGGILMAQAMATGPRSSRWGYRTTAAVSLAAGAGLMAAGLTFLVRRPDQLAATELDEPARQGGALLLTAAGPLLSYGISFLMHRRRSPQRVMVARRD